MAGGTRRLVLLTALAGVVYAAVAVGQSWPLVLGLDTKVLGDVSHPGSQGDLSFQYNLQRQMEQGRIPDLMHTDLLCHPEGMDIDARVAFSLHQALNVALMLMFGLLASRNLAALLMLVGNALAMHLLARERSDRELFAYLAGLLFGFGPYAFIKVQQGFFQKVCLFTVPLFVLLLFRVLERGRVRDQVLCGAAMVLTIAVYPPYAVFNAVFGGLLVVGHALARREIVLQSKRFVPLTVVFLVAFAGVALAIRGDPRPVSMEMTETTFAGFGGFLDWRYPFRWLPYEFTFTHFPAAIIPGLPLGFPIGVTVLAGFAALVGAKRARLLVPIALLFGVVMLPPYLNVGGAPGEPGATSVPMPFLLLGQLPMGSVLKFPIRLYPWVLIALVLAAGSGLRVLEGWLGKVPGAPWLAAAVVPVALAAGIVENRLLFPEYGRFLITEPRLSAFYDEAADEDLAAWLMLPPEPLFPNDYLYVAVMTETPLLNSYMEAPMPMVVPETESSEAMKEGFVEELDRMGVRYVVVHVATVDGGYHGRVRGMAPGAVVPESLPPFAWLDRYCGLPRAWGDDGIVVYEVPRQ